MTKIPFSFAAALLGAFALGYVAPRQPPEFNDQGSGVVPQVTKAQVEATKALNRRAMGGEYILLYERPIDRRFVDWTVQDLGRRMASNAAPDLLRELSELGLSDREARQVGIHRGKIGLASLQAEAGIQQVLAARRDYDRRIRSMLSPANYERYRSYEGSKAFLHEWDMLDDYARGHGVILKPRAREQITQVIKDASGCTETFSHGPYDGLPRIAMGYEAAAVLAREDLARIGEASGRVHAAAVASGLSAEQISLLDEYYSAKQRGKISLLEAADRAKQAQDRATADGRSSLRIESRSDSEPQVPR